MKTSLGELKHQYFCASCCWITILNQLFVFCRWQCKNLCRSFFWCSHDWGSHPLAQTNCWNVVSVTEKEHLNEISWKQVLRLLYFYDFNFLELFFFSKRTVSWTLFITHSYLEETKNRGFFVFLFFMNLFDNQVSDETRKLSESRSLFSLWND